MENRAHALMAGLFVILFGVALAAAGLWFNGNNTAQENYLLISKSPVTGLNPQAAVRYRGLQVGQVDHVSIDAGNNQALLIRISVNPDTPITRGTYAQLAYQGLTGLSYIQLDDDGKNPAPLPTRAEQPAHIEMRASLLQEVGSAAPLVLDRINYMIERMTSLFTDENLQHANNIMANIDGVTQRLITLQDKLTATLGLIAPVATDTQGVLKRTDTLLANVNDLTTSINGLTQDFHTRLKTIDQIAASVQKVASTAENIGKAGEGIGNDLRASTLPKFDQLMDDLSRASKKLDHVLSNAEQQPQSFIFGKPQSRPGPGETGFVAPR